MKKAHKWHNKNKTRHSTLSWEDGNNYLLFITFFWYKFSSTILHYDLVFLRSSNRPQEIQDLFSKIIYILCYKHFSFPFFFCHHNNWIKIKHVSMKYWNQVLYYYYYHIQTSHPQGHSQGGERKMFSDNNYQADSIVKTVHTFLEI